MQGADWGRPEDLFQFCYFVMQWNRTKCSKLFGCQNLHRTYSTFKIPTSLLSPVLNFFFFMSPVHWNTFSYLTASSWIAVKKLLKDVLLITCFYFFSTCCFNFSKISSAVVDTNSFTTFSRDLPPWTKRKKWCEDDSLSILVLLERAGLGCGHQSWVLGAALVGCSFPDSRASAFSRSSLGFWSNQQLYP